MSERDAHPLAMESVHSCPACGGTERASVIDGVRDWFFGCIDGEWSFVECAACHSLYLDPKLRKGCLLAAYENYYTHESIGADKEGSQAHGLRKRLANTVINSRFGTVIQPCFRIPLPEVLAKLLVVERVEARFRYFPKLHPQAAVLDVGCGSGKFLRRIAAAGWQAFGVDFDRAAVQKARAAGIEVLWGDISAAKSFGRRFDAVTLSHVIEHVPDMEAALDQALALLKSDGFLNLEYPNPQCDGRVRFGRYWRGLEAPRHLCLPSRLAIEELLRQKGYRHIEFIDTKLDDEGVNTASLLAAEKVLGTWSEPEFVRSDEPTFLRAFAWS
jgi:2-polyprenyl-3-methyl-5-hydroxy-6-metoxy-1,4-benzoquinol methylase